MKKVLLAAFVVMMAPVIVLVLLLGGATGSADAACGTAIGSAELQQCASGLDGGDGPLDPNFTPVVLPLGTSEGVRAAILYAESQMGKPYCWAGDGGPCSESGQSFASAFDCSGLVMRAWEAGGVSLPHQSQAQYLDSYPISEAMLQPGDLVFFTTNGQPSGIDHVGLYVGWVNGEQTFIQAPHFGAVVGYESFNDWHPDFFGRV